MALPVKQKLPDDYIEEMQRYIEITQDGNRTTSGQAVYTNPRTLASYTTVGSAYDGQGEQGLGLLLYNVNTPQLSNYVLDVDTYNAIQTEINTRVLKSGDTMTGNLNVPTINSKTPSYAITPASATISSGFLATWSGNIIHRKNQEGLKNLNLNLDRSSDILNTSSTIYTLPVDLRPSETTYFFFQGLSSGGSSIAGSSISLTILADGQMLVYSSGTVTTNVRKFVANISYY